MYRVRDLQFVTRESHMQQLTHATTHTYNNVQNTLASSAPTLVEYGEHEDESS